MEATDRTRLFDQLKVDEDCVLHAYTDSVGLLTIGIGRIDVTEAEYQTWLQSLSGKSSEPEGLSILKKNACTGCHSIDGTKLVSASFKGLYGKTEKVLTDGKERSVTVDDAYIKTSVYEPDKDIVVGFPKGVMKTYKGIVTEAEMTKIIEYFKSIK